MKKLLDQWMNLPEADLFRVIQWTPEPLLCKVLEEDFEGQLRGRLQKALSPEAYEKFSRRLFAHRCRQGKRAA